MSSKPDLFFYLRISALVAAGACFLYATTCNAYHMSVEPFSSPIDFHVHRDDFVRDINELYQSYNKCIDQGRISESNSIRNEIKSLLDKIDGELEDKDDDNEQDYPSDWNRPSDRD